MVRDSYWWIVIIGLIVIMFFWASIVTAQGNEYYNIITINNLFRPLGWKPPKLTPKYQLIGTWISKNTEEKVAYVRDIRTNKIYRLAIGDTINNIIIDGIKSNEIQMRTGENYESPTLQFLNTSTGRRSTKRSSVGSSRSKNDSSQTTEKKTKKTTSSNTSRRTGRNDRSNWESQIQRFQTASPGERQKMIEQFRSMRGRRRNNG